MNYFEFKMAQSCKFALMHLNGCQLCQQMLGQCQVCMKKTFIESLTGLIKKAARSENIRCCDKCE